MAIDSLGEGGQIKALAFSEAGDKLSRRTQMCRLCLKRIPVAVMRQENQESDAESAEAEMDS